MKISEKHVMALADAIADTVEPDIRTVEGENFITYDIDDATVLFFEDEAGSPEFLALTFNALGQRFVVNQEFEALMNLSDGGENEIYEVEDETFANALETYIRWRYMVLTRVNI